MEYEIARRVLEPTAVADRAAQNQSVRDPPATITELLGKIFMHSQQHSIALSGHPPIAISGIRNRDVDDSSRQCGSPAHRRMWEGDGEGEVKVDTLPPGGPAAVTMHVGPYDTLRDAYAGELSNG